jgi:hypothetical protein
MYKEEELRKDFSESLEPLIEDKIAQDDPDVIDFYMGVCCTITEEYVKSLADDKLYSEIEDLVIRWSNDGTKTAGNLTRQIITLIKGEDE